MNSELKNDIIPIVIGGSQDLTLAMYDAYQSLEQTINTCSIDYSLDIGDIEEEPKSNGYLTHLLLKDLAIYLIMQILAYKHLTSAKDFELLTNFILTHVL